MKLVRTKVIATKLDCSRQHICRLVRTQGLPCHRWGKCFKFDEQEVDRWIAEHSFDKGFDFSCVDDILSEIRNRD